MNHARLLPLLLPLVLLACKPNNQEDDKSPPLVEYAVSTTAVQRGDIRSQREWVGKLVSTAEAPIIPQIKGYIQERFFTNGQLVQKGEKLYQIQDDLYLQAATEARQKVKSLEATYEKAKQDEAYYQPLVASGSVSRQTYSDAAQVAKAAASSLAQAKAAAAQADINLGYCTLRSPMDGVIGFTKAFVGSYVSPASSSLVVVNMLNPIRVYFSISEQDWIRQGGVHGALSLGAPLELVLADGQLYPHQAKIQGVDNQVNSSTGSLMLDARVENPDDLLRPGMYVLVRAQMGVLRDVLKIPVSAVVQVQGKNMVLLYSKGGAVEMRPVELGVREGAWVQVLGDSLQVGDELISQGTQQGMMAAMGRARVKVQHAQ